MVRSPPAPVDEQLPRGVPPGITSGAPDPSAAGSAAAPTTVVATLVVDVGGAVARPGLVRVGRGARVADVVAAAGGATHGSPGAAPVDLNSATAEQLDALPGVGPATAAAIVAYRTQHGPFRSVDELLQVHGIGPAKLAALRSKVRV